MRQERPVWAGFSDREWPGKNLIRWKLTLTARCRGIGPNRSALTSTWTDGAHSDCQSTHCLNLYYLDATVNFAYKRALRSLRLAEDTCLSSATNYKIRRIVSCQIQGYCLAQSVTYLSLPKVQFVLCVFRQR